MQMHGSAEGSPNTKSNGWGLAYAARRVYQGFSPSQEKLNRLPFGSRKRSMDSTSGLSRAAQFRPLSMSGRSISDEAASAGRALDQSVAPTVRLWNDRLLHAAL